MRNRTSLRIGLIASCAGITLAATLGGLGCGSGGNSFEFLGSPFTQFAAPGTGNGNVNTNSRGTPGTGGGGLGGTGSRTPVDACAEAQSRKFVRISLRNQSEDFIHYFLVFIARVDVNNDGGGSVCPDDIDLYTSFGYTLVNEGDSQEFGSICVDGPALLYFHRNGQFRAAGGQQFASAIQPAQGASPLFDAFFGSGGAQVPVPDRIIFSNPGSGEGQNLLVSRPLLSPCSAITVAGDPVCRQDAFYYVSDDDQFSGTTQIGLGSGRRVPAEIQDTGCSCRGINDPAQVLAPSGVTANSALCNEFLRGGSITYVFLRDDRTPAFPQLLWRVTDAGGAVVHDFDDRAGI